MKVAVMGYGTVGSGVVEVIEHHSDIIPKRTGGKTLEISHILDLRDFPNDAHKDLFTKDFNDILNDEETKIVAETMGGVNPAFDFTMKLLKAGKSVVTSNKELVAQRGLELLQAAEESGANYLFEASVGGGIPIIRPLCQCLAANYIEGIAGILNGTTNFILTMMIEKGMSFDEALKIAQEKGYAERTRQQTLRVTTHAARFVFLHLLLLASTFIQIKLKPKESQTLHLRMYLTLKMQAE